MDGWEQATRYILQKKNFDYIFWNGIIGCMSRDVFFREIVPFPLNCVSASIKWFYYLYFIALFLLLFHSLWFTNCKWQTRKQWIRDMQLMHIFSGSSLHTLDICILLSECAFRPFEKYFCLVFGLARTYWKYIIQMQSTYIINYMIGNDSSNLGFVCAFVVSHFHEHTHRHTHRNTHTHSCKTPSLAANKRCITPCVWDRIIILENWPEH